MTFYKLSLKELPAIQFACSASTDQYRNHIDHKGTLEITTIEQSAVTLSVDGAEYSVPPRSVIVIMPDTVCDLRGGQGLVQDDTIAMRCGGLHYETIEWDGGESPIRSDEDCLLLPMILTPGDGYQNLTRLIRTFISSYMREDASSRYRCLSRWFELLACLNDASRAQIAGLAGEDRLPSSQVYVKKAKSYIERHYASDIHIGDVAEELRITPNYLSSMFKSITGKTVLDYIHITRIQAVKDCLNSPKPPPLAEIAAKTGIGNARTLYTLFKKTCGVSVRDYLRISRELTVYHDRPWDK